jgi:DeoR family fructose operon transcriptional repressor
VGSDHFARFGNLEVLDVLVTDSGLEPDAAAQLAAAGPRVVLA